MPVSVLIGPSHETLLDVQDVLTMGTQFHRARYQIQADCWLPVTWGCEFEFYVNI